MTGAIAALLADKLKLPVEVCAALGAGLGQLLDVLIYALKRYIKG